MWLGVNDDVTQRSAATNMVLGTAHIVWYLSQFIVLEPGDLIETGTPGGVGNLQDLPRFLRAGDVIEVGSTASASSAAALPSSPS
jgi:2,4-diketo-3-deoxy-L-fuconate hydrolase